MTADEIVREKLFRIIGGVVLSRYAKLTVRQAIGPTGVYEIVDAILANAPTGSDAP